MCNFNKQTDETKALIALLMQKFAATVGGANFFLSLIETMKEQRPSPLLVKEQSIVSQHAKIGWNKKVFKDKVDLIREITLEHKSEDGLEFNILDIESQKKKKTRLNMVKTLLPIEFKVTPTYRENGSGFTFKVFEKIDLENEVVTLNPVFVALFFCSADYTKKALKYEA